MTEVAAAARRTLGAGSARVSRAFGREGAAPTVHEGVADIAGRRAALGPRGGARDPVGGPVGSVGQVLPRRPPDLVVTYWALRLLEWTLELALAAVGLSVVLRVDRRAGLALAASALLATVVEIASGIYVIYQLFHGEGASDVSKCEQNAGDGINEQFTHFACSSSFKVGRAIVVVIYVLFWLFIICECARRSPLPLRRCGVFVEWWADDLTVR